jgi:hypothetical protein
MGWLRLRKKDIKLALSDRHLNKNLAKLNTPEKMIEYYEKLAKKKGIRVLPKSSFFGPNFQRMTTTYPKQIRLGKNYPTYPSIVQGPIWPHEFVHVDQWDYYGIKFGILYLLPRKSWAFEMQAYRESVCAKKVLGVSRKELEAYINSRPRSLWKGYPLMRQIRWKDFKKQTVYVLRKGL